MIDHQPWPVKEAADLFVDLYLAGHTHAGQIFPLSLIVNLVYVVPWGFKKINNTNIYVSCGLGTCIFF